MAQSLWEQGREAYNTQMSTYFHTPEPGQKTVQQEDDFLSIMEKFNASLAIYREEGDRQSEADLLTWLTRVCLETGKYADAFKYLKESSDIYDKLNSGPGDKVTVKDTKKAMKAMFYFITGMDKKDEGDYKSALKKYETTLKLLRKMGERSYEARILNEIGVLHYELMNYSDAEHSWEEAINISRELGNKGNEGRLFYNMAVLCNNKGENTKSLEYTEKALKIFEQFKDKNGMLMSLAWKGSVYYYQNDYTKALDFYEQALVHTKDIEDKKVVVELSESLGDIHKGMGYFNIPLDYYKQALDIVQEAGNDPREGDMLNTIGKLYSKMGDYKEALKVYGKAMQIYEAQNSMIDQGEVLIEIGKVNSKQGDYTKAIDNLKGALEIFEGIEDRDASKSLALIALEDVHRLLGDNESAKEYDSINKNIKKPDTKAKWSQWWDLQDLGYNLLGKKEYDKALNIFSQSLDLSKEISVSYERQSLTNIGYVYKRLEKYTVALSFYNKALKVSREHNAKGEELATLLIIAAMYDYPWLSDYPNALDYYEQALVIAKETGDRPSEEKCLTSIGKLYMDVEKDEKAEEYLKKALLVSSEMGAQEKIWETQNNLAQLA